MTTHNGNLQVNAPQAQFITHNMQTVQLGGPSGASVSGCEDTVNPTKILRKRMCVGAAFDSAERGDPPRCHKGTRTAILKSGSSWANDLAAVYVFLWITGWAGVGKSAILQTLAETYRTQRRLAASFFFSQASRDRRTTRGFIATIALQLMGSVPGAREIITNKISSNPTIFDETSFEGQWQTLIVDTLHDVQPPSAPLLIVIDGVDEIESEKEQCDLLRAILPRLFKEFSICKESKIELGNTENDKADLALFLQLSFDEIYRKRKRLSASETTSTTPSWLDQATLDGLVKKASGQFIYARTVVHFVENLSQDPKVVLEMITNRGVHSKSFKELDYLYLLLMDRITRSIPEKHHLVLHYLLVCVQALKNTSLPSTIDVFFPRTLGNNLLDTLLSKLHPVVDKWCQYRHKSFTEFLTQPSAPHPFSITSWHISSVTSQILRSNPQDFDLVIANLRQSSPTPELIFCLMTWQNKSPINSTIAISNGRPATPAVDGSSVNSVEQDSFLVNSVEQDSFSVDSVEQASFSDNSTEQDNSSVISASHELAKCIWDDSQLCCWTLGWVSVEYKWNLTEWEKVTVDRPKKQKFLHYCQVPLFLAIGLPYYAWMTVKQTSPYFYKMRTYDLPLVGVPRSQQPQPTIGLDRHTTLSTIAASSTS
ncbi:hypothetical protein BDN72DRAFT_842722 [Pluteus cervinus]|uniref:Uncharacterized protein n=1 Tax=Pluteus cervinus TaxID=181527 RepID=A0ACD3AQ83_9AGAR|nr:hypothetical protein BDN72DRAFT_842722 [Pluteus cervinus]